MMVPDGNEGSALAAATQWVVQALTGSAATAVATIAIAFIGFCFLQGRIDAKRAARTVLGCFIVFGAPTIGAALTGAHGGEVEQSPAMREAAPPPPVPPAPMPHDPYSGASVPVR